MTPPELDLPVLLAAAQAVADEADALSLAHFTRGVTATAKADGTPVTVADREVESLVRARLAEAFPDHAHYGEEQGGTLDPAVPTWVLDPIDGTKNFLRGVPVWATLLALVVDGSPVLGVASAPALRERWDAARGLGARRNGRRAAVSGTGDLEEASVLHGGLGWFRQVPGGWDLLGRITDRAGRTRGYGDFWMHLLVAGGMAEAAIERDLKPWDLAALICIVEEAGGRLTAWDGGQALPSGEALTTNGRLHDELLAVVAGP